MLSDHERQELQEIEQQLRNEDPAFARSFRPGAKDRPHRRRAVLTASILVWCLLTLVSAVAGAIGTAVTCAAVALGLAAAWHWKALLKTAQALRSSP